MKATYYALANTYKYLTPDFWGKPEDTDLPFELHSAWLHTKAAKPTANNNEGRRDRKERSDRPPRENREDRQPREGREPRQQREPRGER